MNKVINDLWNVIDFIGEKEESIKKGYKVDECYSFGNIEKYIRDIIMDIDSKIDNIDDSLFLVLDLDKFEIDLFSEYIDNDVEFKGFRFVKNGVLVEERDESEIWVLWDFLRMKNEYDYDWFMFLEELLSMVNNKYIEDSLNK